MAKRKSKTRRGHGEGSVYQRADGYWVGAVEAGRCPGGHQRKDGTICKGGERLRARVVRTTKNAVIGEFDSLQSRAGAGVYGPDSTIEDYSHYWRKQVKGNTVAASTLTGYAQRFDNWIIPYIGKIKLRTIAGHGGVERLQGWQTTLEAEGLAPSSRSDARTALSMMLRYAVGARVITWNPAEYVTTPKADSANTDDAFTAEEAEAVLRAAEGDRLEGLYALAVKYGMREGELIALPDDLVDLDKDMLRVSKAKSRAGVRDLPLLAGVSGTLGRHRERREAEKATAGAAWKEHGLFFCKPDGTPLTHRYVLRAWNVLLAKAGVAHRCRKCASDEACSTSVRRFHASRHSAATLLLEAGVPLEVVSAILGHSGIRITADLYAKVRANLMRRGLLKLDEVAG